MHKRWKALASVAVAAALVIAPLATAGAVADDAPPPDDTTVVAPVEEVAPPLEEAKPVEPVAEPEPVVADPPPVVSEPEPVVTDPEPVVSDPEPVVADPPAEESTVTPTGGYEKEHKWYVCKYVGKPGVDERLQTGDNPIFVDEHSIASFPNIVLGAFFADAQGRSVVIAGPYEHKPYEEPGVEDCPPADEPDETTPTLTYTPPTCDADGVVSLFGAGIIWSAVLNDDGSTTYTATAAEGFVFPEGVQTQWTVPNLDRLPEDSDECALIEVTPWIEWTPPTCDAAGTFSQSEEPGIVWTSVGNEDGSTTYTAAPDEGYVFPEGTQTEWTVPSLEQLDPESEECFVPTPTTLGLPTTVDECGTEDDFAFLPDGTESVTYAWVDAEDPENYDIVATVADGFEVQDAPDGWSEQEDGTWLYSWVPLPEFSDEPCAVATLDGSFITPTCISDAAYLVGTIAIVDPDDQVPDDAEATITMTDGTNTFTYPQTFPLGDISVLWPGASVDPVTGFGVTWPGFITNPDGTYTATDDPAYFGWTRGGVTVTVEVNPEFSTTVDYPPSSPLCLTSPPNPPDDDTPPPLAATGNGTDWRPWTLGALAGILAGLSLMASRKALRR